MTQKNLKYERDATIADQNGNKNAISIANINKNEQRKRLIFGMISFFLAIGILAIQISTGTGRIWRLPLFFLYAGATIGYFQAREKT